MSWVLQHREEQKVGHQGLAAVASHHHRLLGAGPACFDQTLWGDSDENALLRKRTCIASFRADHPNGSWKRAFLNRSQGGKIRKHSPPVFMWTANPYTFQNDDVIAPPCWTARQLVTTTTTMVDYMLVIVLQKILSLSCNLLTCWVWVAAAVRPHLLLVVLGFSVYCLFFI